MSAAVCLVATRLFFWALLVFFCKKFAYHKKVTFSKLDVAVKEDDGDKGHSLGRGHNPQTHRGAKQKVIIKKSTTQCPKRCLWLRSLLKKWRTRMRRDMVSVGACRSTQAG